MFQAWSNECLVAGVPTLRCLPIVFQNLTNAALVFAGIVAAFFIVYAGIMLVTSGGDPKKVEGGKKILTYAIIGLIVILMSFAVIFLISYLTRTDCITKFSVEGCTGK